MTRVSVSLIALLWLNSLVAQTLLFQANYPVSFLAFVYWTAIYVAIGVGLVRRARLAYWMGLILSVLQLVPAPAWSFGILGGPVSNILSGWYPVSLWVAFGLGLGLLLSLCTKGGFAGTTRKSPSLASQ